MSIEENEKREETLRGQQPADQAEGGYGSPTPEDEMPDDAATNPGSPDPTLRGQETDEEALSDDVSLGAPDKSFFEDEEAGSDGEPGAGRLGGTDDQYREELDRAEGSAARIAPGDESSLDLPSADAPLNDSNTESARQDRESFSSQPEADADGAGR